VENALWQWADCDVLWNTYEHAHVALCSSAMPSLLSLWASLFISAVAAILGGLLSDFASRQAMQRQRDSKSMSRSLWAMMGAYAFLLAGHVRMLLSIETLKTCVRAPLVETMTLAVIIFHSHRTIPLPYDDQASA
jgi:hypothetical protein